MNPSILDVDSYKSLTRACANALSGMLGWDESQIADWISAEIDTRADGAVLYNEPPAAVLAKAFVPQDASLLLSGDTLQAVITEIYIILESRGHWNDFNNSSDREYFMSQIKLMLSRVRGGA